MQDTLENVHPSPELNAPDKAPAVRDMFAQIAPTYDRVNHILSASIDKRWRRLTVEALEDVLKQDSAIALDICCGTGDTHSGTCPKGASDWMRLLSSDARDWARQNHFARCHACLPDRSRCAASSFCRPELQCGDERVWTSQSEQCARWSGRNAACAQAWRSCCGA